MKSLKIWLQALTDRQAVWVERVCWILFAATLGFMPGLYATGQVSSLPVWTALPVTIIMMALAWLAFTAYKPTTGFYLPLAPVRAPTGFLLLGVLTGQAIF